MYSDKIISGSRKRSVKDRLGENGPSNDVRQSFSKRFHEDDGKWEHDLYNEADKRIIIKGGQSQDLRAKLRKSVSQGSQGGSSSRAIGIKDLREKLSGATQPAQPPLVQSRSPPMVSAPQQRSVTEVKAATVAPAKTSVGKPAALKPSGLEKPSTESEAVNLKSFLQSLGLSKYLISFQAEEIDMSVLRVMKDEDLKELGIPMGPRKKIALALASHSKQR